MAVGELNLSLMEYYDKTLFELSIEIQGYNRRWAEEWRKVRKLHAPAINAIVKKPKSEMEWIPLPGDEDIKAFRDKFDGLKERLRLEHSVKNGSGISTEI